MISTITLRKQPQCEAMMFVTSRIQIQHNPADSKQQFGEIKPTGRRLPAPVRERGQQVPFQTPANGNTARGHKGVTILTKILSL